MDNPVLVGVFEKRALLVCLGDDEGVLDVVLVLVLVIDVVVVFVVVVDGETNLLDSPERDKVVVFVEVLLFVDVDVNITFNGPRFRCWTPGPAPAAKNSPNKPNNLRLTILYIIYKLTLDQTQQSVLLGRFCSNILIQMSAVPGCQVHFCP